MKISNMKELSQSTTDTLMKCSTRTISARVRLCALLARVKTAPMLTLPWKMSLLSDQLSKARTTSLWLTMDLPPTKRSIVIATVSIQTGGALNLVMIAIKMLPFKKDLAFAEERISKPRLAPTSTTSRQPSHRIVSEDAIRLASRCQHLLPWTSARREAPDPSIASSRCNSMKTVCYKVI